MTETLYLTPALTQGEIAFITVAAVFVLCMVWLVATLRGYKQGLIKGSEISLRNAAEHVHNAHAIYDFAGLPPASVGRLERFFRWQALAKPGDPFPKEFSPKDNSLN